MLLQPIKYQSVSLEARKFQINLIIWCHQISDIMFEHLNQAHMLFIDLTSQLQH
jgi:hypothetical protein